MCTSSACTGLAKAAALAILLAAATCAGPKTVQSPTGAGGTGGSKGGAGGTTSTGGTQQADAPIAAGGTGGTSASGGTVSDTGGASTPQGSGGGGGAGGDGGSSGGAGGTTTSSGGTAGTSASGGAGGGAGGGPGGSPHFYYLDPPSRCHDQDFIPWGTGTSGCRPGDATSLCGGKCSVSNACSENKPGVDVTFMCQRNLLFSPEFEQAVLDDGNAGFHYAVAGHDVGSPIDGDAKSPCCQCYQLVYAYPSPANDRQALANPDNPGNPPKSAFPSPEPLIVQVFNTAATATTFDIYMPAGGLGANNACAKVAGGGSTSGLYMYTDYPPNGQPGNGGVKPAAGNQTGFPECRTTTTNWFTPESLGTPACQQKLIEACSKFKSDIPGLADFASKGCLRTNHKDSLYHLNWSVYVMKVECPDSLTRVTGCKLAPQGLPKVKKDVKTAELAAKDPDFKTNGGTLYETTTMEDCCRPSCAATSWTMDKGLKTDPDYRVFYLCNQKGEIYVQPKTP